ncbi:glycerophosphodiester phosphodiesterase [Lentibacillus juripiscarius]|uniref:Glycerophosphodiester phosphodiesterase n=1 Tax=Lentibacillus juripiscarius TaxID=257446 RepID=A0ABW5V5B3_9BACI
MKRLFKQTAILSVAVMGFFFLSPIEKALAAQDNNYENTIKTIAHRGSSGHAPENTIAAYDLGFEQKADYIEIDVQMTKDDKLVSIHDTTVNRTTDGTGSVGDYTLEELRNLDAGSWYDESFAGEKIPTFEEILDRYRGKIGILIELKSPGLYPGVEQKVADALIERNMHKPNNNKIIVQSFNHDSVKRFHSILPSMPVGVLVGYGQAENGEITDEHLEGYAAYADYVNPNKSLLDHDTVDRIHQHGLKTWPYTIVDQEWVDRLMGYGVDGIITDYPELMDFR